MANWVIDHIPYVSRIENFAAIGVEENGELIAGWVYSEFRGNDIQISVAAINPRWAQRSFLRAFFAYPFAQLGCDRVTALTASTNHRARSNLVRLGFVQEGVIRQGYKHDDCIIYGILKSECKW